MQKSVAYMLRKHYKNNRPFVFGIVLLATLVVLGGNYFITSQRVTYQSSAHWTQSLDFLPRNADGTVNTDLFGRMMMYGISEPTVAPTNSQMEPYATPSKPPAQKATPTEKPERPAPGNPTATRAPLPEITRGSTPTRAPLPDVTRGSTPTSGNGSSPAPTSGSGAPGPSDALQPQPTDGGGSSGGNSGNHGSRVTPTQPPVCQATQLPQNLTAVCVNSTTIRYTWTPKDTTTTILVNKWENDEGAIDFQKDFPPGTTSWDLTGLDPNGTYTYWATAKNACGELKGFAFGAAPPLKCGISAQGEFSVVKSRPDLDISCAGRKINYVGDTISFDVKARAGNGGTLERAEIWLGQYNLSQWSNGCPTGMTLTPNKIWCKMTDVTMSGATFNKTITWTPEREGKYYVMIKGKETGNALMCSGNPQCTFNASSGTIDCTQSSYYGGAYDCGAQDSTVVDVSNFDGKCSDVSIQASSIKEGDALIVKWKGLPLKQGLNGFYTIDIFNSATNKALSLSGIANLNLQVSDLETTSSRVLQIPSTVLRAGSYYVQISNGSSVTVKSAPFTVVAAPILSPDMRRVGVGPVIQTEGFDVVIRNFKTTSEIILQRVGVSPKPPSEVGIDAYMIGDTCKTDTGCRMHYSTTALVPTGQYELQLFDGSKLVSTIAFTVQKASPRCPVVTFNCDNLVNDGKSGGNAAVTVDNHAYIATNKLSLIREYPNGEAYDSLDATPPMVDITSGKFGINLIGMGAIHLFPQDLTIDSCPKIQVPAKCQSYPTPTPTNPPGQGGALVVTPARYTMTNLTDTVKISWQNMSGVTALDSIELYKYKSTATSNPIASQLITFSWGSVTFFLPKDLAPGSYEFRYYNSSLGLGGRKLMATTGEFVVLAAQTAPVPTITPPAPYIEANPATISIGQMERKTIKVSFGAPKNAYYVSLYSTGTTPRLMTETYIPGTTVDGGATSGVIDFALPVPGIDTLTSGTYNLKLFGDKQNSVLLAYTPITLTIIPPAAKPTATPSPTIKTVYSGGVVINIGTLRTFDFNLYNKSFDLLVGYLPADPTQFEWTIYNSQDVQIAKQPLSALTPGTIFSSTTINVPVTQPLGEYQIRLENKTTGEVPPLSVGAYGYGYPLPNGTRPTDARLVFHIVQSPPNTTATATIAPPTATPTLKPMPAGYAFGIIGINWTNVGGSIYYSATVPAGSSANHEVRLVNSAGTSVFSTALCTVGGVYNCTLTNAFNTTLGPLPKTILAGKYKLKLIQKTANTEIYSWDVEIR